MTTSVTRYPVLVGIDITLMLRNERFSIYFRVLRIVIEMHNLCIRFYVILCESLRALNQSTCSDRGLQSELSLLIFGNGNRRLFLGLMTCLSLILQYLKFWIFWIFFSIE